MIRITKGAPNIILQLILDHEVRHQAEAQVCIWTAAGQISGLVLSQTSDAAKVVVNWQIDVTTLIFPPSGHCYVTAWHSVLGCRSCQST